MTDLVERLRTWAAIHRHGAIPADHLVEAAAEIERLHELVGEHNIHTTSATTIVDELQAEVERLRGEIEQYRERLGLR